MCGIIGYVGHRPAAPVLARGLKRIEYRGYDSAGFGIIEEKAIVIRKDVGKIDEIQGELSLSQLRGTTGIAHTRWATHGGVARENSHPFLSCDGKIAIAHNGIIEKHLEIKDKLLAEGHKFSSETDSEVIAHLLEKYYAKYRDRTRAVLETVNLLKGTFAILLLFRDEPSSLIGVRKDSPLAVGLGGAENFLASDVLAFIDSTDRVIFLDDREVAVVGRNKVEILSFDGRKVARQAVQVAWEASDVSKREFAHFTLKEIHEQAETIKAALRQDEGRIKTFCQSLKDSDQLYITACGTSYHAGLIAKHLLARLVRMPSEVVVSSEFSQYVDFVGSGTTMLAISQSGETADVLSAIRAAKEKGAKVLSIVNVESSSLVRESDMSISINCGPEIGVAATKSFTAQLMLIYLLAFKLANRHEELKDMLRMQEYVKEASGSEGKVVEMARKYRDADSFYYVGRSIHLPIAFEGALKMKELSYIHAEGMAAGELKHGTLALIDRGTPVVVINPEDETYDETVGNAAELRARGADVIGVSNRPNPTYTEFIPLPTLELLFYPIVEVIPLQLLAYHMAVQRQRDPDYPRHLAKSVTVK